MFEQEAVTEVVAPRLEGEQCAAPGVRRLVLVGTQVVAEDIWAHSVVDALQCGLTHGDSDTDSVAAIVAGEVEHEDHAEEDEVRSVGEDSEAEEEDVTWSMAPTNRETTSLPSLPSPTTHLFCVILLRRLRALSLSVRNCRCGRPLDT